MPKFFKVFVSILVIVVIIAGIAYGFMPKLILSMLPPDSRPGTISFCSEQLTSDELWRSLQNYSRIIKKISGTFPVSCKQEFYLIKVLKLV